jgi:hypothetical protein
MKVAISESAGRREFVDWVKDTYERKLVRLCEMRSLYNGFLLNFTQAKNPGSSAYDNALKPIYPIVREAVAKLPEPILVVYDQLDNNTFPDVDYIICHSPQDAEAILSLSKPGEDLAKVLTRNRNFWKTAQKDSGKKIILLNYDERFSDIVDVIEEGEGGVAFRITPATISDRKAPRASSVNEDLAIARLFDPQGGHNGREAGEGAGSEDNSET